MNILSNAVVSLVFGVLGALIFALSQSYFHGRDIAVVRLDEIIAEHLTEHGKKKMSPDEQEKVSAAFAKALDQAIVNVSAEQGVILMVAPAVVSDVQDYTQAVRNEVGELLNAVQGYH